MRIFVSGACGYIGSALVPHLLANGHHIVAFDPQWFGNGFLPDNENLTVFKNDLRDGHQLGQALKGCTAVIHLAGMTNDNECRKSPEEAKEVNEWATRYLMKLSYNYGVKRFIFPSSVAAYGNSKRPVYEIEPLFPTTPYGKSKAYAEEILVASKMKWFILRPAGVFGYAPRMRFDLPVNMMTCHAALEGQILVAGGEQIRPVVHIRDLIDVILRLLTANIESNVFNVVYSNNSVMDAAKRVKATVQKHLKREVEIVVSERTDDRSYAVSGDKLRQVLSFDCRRNIEDGVAELCQAFKRGQWSDALQNPVYRNVIQRG